jgi:hypothetical protein
MLKKDLRMKKYLICSLSIFMYGAQSMALTIKSSSFNQNTMMPQKYSKEGDNRSPQLSWDDAPAATKSFALIVDDPDAPGKTWVHWILFNIPSTKKELKEGETPKEAVIGINDFKARQYDGPMPPQGHGKHHYRFTLYALDSMIDLPAGTTKDQLLNAMQGHILEQAQIIGLYERK